ncbi:conserved protein of unknown function (Prok-E2_A 53-169; ThiF 360-472; Prok-JAB 611-730) (plasmid) [Magnetospirillum sp. XM-1]|uniref:Mov34/MPN/PAD-1 family protein n=1 Tax=Magnetospirillum sp. XM-1 TaxID=1663591 RepID=UPI00073DD2BA|nr:Mov34/MPN/PAD-1 family protein [Magnetospirillum sp. XM-1]CUW41857.1 conserved protein of unknown function (Prok-E2_A 53-169; ThiF 360-472; Prok-JAB 611-730) [Magnetospirillum sp. XM-1]
MLPAVFGDESDIASLSTMRARALATALAAGEIAGARLIAVYHRPGLSTLHAELDVAVSQVRAKDIRPTEDVAIAFDDADQSWPYVHAMRADFPTDLAHLTCNEPGFPVGLCISEDPFDDVKPHWTAPRFVRHLQSWFERAAEDTLHADDQGLDPVMLHRDGELIVPHRLVTSADDVPVHAYQLADSGVFFLEEPGARQGGVPLKPEFVCARMLAPPRQHGVLFLQMPRTLKALIDRLEQFGWPSCRAEVAKQIQDWRYAEHGGLKPLFLVTFPLLRNLGDAEPETYATWAVASANTVEQIAIDLGIAASGEGLTGTVIGDWTSPEATGGAATPLWHLNPRNTLSPEAASVYNNRLEASSRRTVVIGAGALGSQVLANAMKAGFLPTQVIDHDRMMPHNIARHVLGREAIGWEKATAMTLVARATLDTDSYPEPIVADVLRPGDNEPKLVAALEAADLVVDLSASPAVSAALAADARFGAPRLSMFLNPSGTDLVVLAEVRSRTIPLDHLEAQYYWAVATDERLSGHLRSNERVRYGRSCRDLSGRISQAHVATLSGIASEMLLRAANGGDLPAAAIWRCDPETMSVARLELAVEPMRAMPVGEWTIHLAPSLVRELAAKRTKKLPRETGGCLLGTWNVERGVIHVVGSLSAPPDSKEKPSSFVRGYIGQEAAVAAVAEKTAGMLSYVGEWHSHPPGTSTDPSEDDVALYGWLDEHMADEGYPAVMLIVGDGGDLTLVVSGTPPVPLGVG